MNERARAVVNFGHKKLAIISHFVKLVFVVAIKIDVWQSVEDVSDVISYEE